jgi:hypothetical protein
VRFPGEFERETAFYDLAIVQKPIGIGANSESPEIAFPETSSQCRVQILQ